MIYRGVLIRSGFDGKHTFQQEDFARFATQVVGMLVSHEFKIDKPVGRVLHAHVNQGGPNIEGDITIDVELATPLPEPFAFVPAGHANDKDIADDITGVATTPRPFPLDHPFARRIE